MCPSRARGSEVLVVGSINYDIYLHQERLPVEGETLLATDVTEAFGGKGANQAVQCVRLGALVSFIGAVGVDERGTSCVDNLVREGIDCSVAVVDRPTGLGVVNLLTSGAVVATVAQGANLEVTDALVDRHIDHFSDLSFLLLQNEIAESGIRRAMDIAREREVRIVYNAAPATSFTLAVAPQCDVLIVNEEEAMACLGRRLAGLAELSTGALELAAYGPDVVVTLGERGALVCTGGQVTHLPAWTVEPVDTTGAGDSFVGAFTVAVMRGLEPVSAARSAIGVAAMTTKGRGAQTSMPRAFTPEEGADASR